MGDAVTRTRNLGQGHASISIEPTYMRRKWVAGIVEKVPSGH